MRRALEVQLDPGPSLGALGLEGPRDHGPEAVRILIAIWEAAEPGELAYRIADTPCREVINGGRPVYRAAPIEFLT